MLMIILKTSDSMKILLDRVVNPIMMKMSLKQYQAIAERKLAHE